VAAGAWRALEPADSAESAGGGGCWLPSPQVAAAVGWRREVASAGEEKWRLAAGEVAAGGLGLGFRPTALRECGLRLCVRVES
jgi:hypothetical protein